MSRSDKIKIAVLLSIWAVLFIPIYPELVQDWLAHSDNTHGFLVPIIAGYLAWQKKDKLKLATISISLWGNVVLFLSLATHVLSYAGGLAFPSRVALVLSLLGLIWSSLGLEIAKIIFPPVMFLLFMIPVPYSLMNFVSVPLQLMATRISGNIIVACSIPVYREGNILYFMNTQLEVAEACSGIRSVMALTMLAVIFASMLQDGWKKRTIMVVSAIPIAMIANILRISGTGILAHFFGDKVARGFLHEFSGIAIFIFGLGVLWQIFTIINRGKSENVK